MNTKEIDPYVAAGVNYEKLDPFKRACQEGARKTDRNAYDLEVIPWTRGESVTVYRRPNDPHGRVIGHVEEGLGTKNLVADRVSKLTGQTHYYRYIAQDTVAMIVNDMITIGIRPDSIAMHLAVGDSDWFDDTERYEHLIDGWADGCNAARCIWAGGETPALKQIIFAGTCLLSGSGVGHASCEKNLFNPERIKEGDAIILLESSGIHANGLSFARKLAKDHPYDTQLSDGRTYGETLLDPTHIYVQFILDCLNVPIDIHYGVHITGHGWAKLMRAPQPFSYVIDTLPTQQPIFQFLQETGRLSPKEAYKLFNMGAGFAIFVSQEDVEKVLGARPPLTPEYPYRVFVGGRVEKSDRKKVVISPLGIEYQEQDLAIR